MLLILLLFAYAFWRARWIVPHAPRGVSGLVGVWILLAIQSCLQTAWYYSSLSLNAWVDICLSLVSLLMLELYVRWRTKASIKPNKTNVLGAEFPKRTVFVDMGICLIALGAAGFVLQQARWHATTEAIRTPWPLMPAGTLAAIALVFMCGWFALRRNGAAWLQIGLAALNLLSVSAIVPLVYRQGFGFDGFLHRASERILLTMGTLSPKPLYYIGQYVFVTWIVRWSHLPLAFVDRWLVPGALAFLPVFFYLGRRVRPIELVAFILLLPLAPFSATTPQAFAYLLGLFAIVCMLHEADTAAVPLCIWSVATHPLAGLPFLGAAITLKAVRYAGPWRRTFIGTSVALTSLSVPVAFFVLAWRSHGALAWHLESWLRLSDWLTVFASTTGYPINHASLWADLSDKAAYLYPTILIALAIIGIKKDLERRSAWMALSVLSVGLAAAATILSLSLDFSFLIDYERSNYIARLILIAGFCLVFPASAGAGILLERLRQQRLVPFFIISLLLGGAQAVHAYASLPHHDAAHAEHGWSVSRADEDTVRWIERDAHAQTYTVLANQNVSAAAVEAFGFKRYAGDVFFYPIPTGGALYQTFLKAADEHVTREGVCQAAQLGQSRLVYVVINPYWWHAKTVNEMLLQLSDANSDIDHQNIVYRFDCLDKTQKK